MLITFSCKEDINIDKTIHSLPRMEITIDEEKLWSPDSGLYVIGRNGIGNYCIPTKANYNQKWEYPATVEYFIKNELAFSDRVGFRIKGNCSRSLSMKSIGLYWRSEYGNSKLQYPLFEHTNTTTFKRLVLRNSGNDFGYTQMKDAVNGGIIRGMANVDVQSYQPCVVNLNGDYWGIHNLREMISPRWFQYLYGVDEDKVDILGHSELLTIVEFGDDSDFKTDVIQFLDNNDVSITKNYNILAQKVDISSYVDYIIIQTYIANKDWPKANTRWWRDKTSINHNKWTWIFFDSDLSLELGWLDRVWIGDLYENNAYRQDREGGFFIFNHLIKNKTFKAEFLNRYLYFLDNVFTIERTASVINGIKSKISGEYPNHQKKWGVASVSSWNKQVEDMKKFYKRRNPIMREIIKALINE